ncbi:MAG: hypothetical protein QM796_00695 [Chthoniobacteraceae bacterium]
MGKLESTDKKAAAPKATPAKKPAAKKTATKAAPAAAKAPKKAAKAPARKPAALPPAPAPSYDDIALRAYFISEKRQQLGLPGDSSQDWVEAERQLVGEATAKKPARKTKATE